VVVPRALAICLLETVPGGDEHGDPALGTGRRSGPGALRGLAGLRERPARSEELPDGQVHLR
jgi:hypothetical protein